MEHTTFAKKTVVLAALGALSLMAATVRADETETPSAPEAKSIIVTIGQTGDLGIASEIKDTEASVTWDDEWLKKETVLGENKVFDGLSFNTGSGSSITVSGEGSLTIALPTQTATDADNDGKYVTFNGVNLAVKDGGSFSNSSHLKFTDGGSLTVANGDFTNGKDRVIEFDGTKFDLSVTKTEAVGNFENTGKIVLSGNASMTVGSGDVLKTTSDDELTLNVGNVTIGAGATLTNQDKGYQLDKSKAEQADGEGAEGDETQASQTLVQFGTVTVDGGQFVNAEGALSKGNALVIQSVDANKKAVEINGTSVWGTLNLKKVDGAKDVSNYVTIAEAAGDKAGGDFRVTGALVIDEFGADASGNAGFTIDGQTNDAKVFADGIDISAGSHVDTSALELNSDGAGLDWVNDKTPSVGTLKLTGFAATYKTETEGTEKPEGEAKAETGDDETVTVGSWTNKKFGNVTAKNTNLVIENNRASDKDLGNGYMPSIEMASLSLVGSSMKIAYDTEVGAIKKKVLATWKELNEGVDVDGLEEVMRDWDKGDILDRLKTLLAEDKYQKLKEELDGDRESYEDGLAGVLTSPNVNVASTISDSDLAIGTLTLSRNSDFDGMTVKVEKTENENTSESGEATQADESEGSGEGEAPDPDTETVAITGDDVYELGTLKLDVTDSRIDVDTLDLQTGSVTLDQNSIMMIGNVKTLNGDLTLKSGYLGLNVTTSVAEHLKPKDTPETQAESEEKTYTATVEVGSPITIGSNGQLSFGQNTATGKRADDAQTQTDSVAIGFYTDTNIVFDGKNFNSEALFSQDRADGEKGLVSVGDKGSINIQGQNLSWGVYKIFDSDTLDTTGLDEVKISADGSSASGLWNGADVKVDGNEIVVGDKTIEGSGLDIGAVNLANSVVGGDRGSALDKVLFNHILSNGKSLDEISNTINSITAMGAVAGLTAMTVDFGAYVTDQVEHHAVTIPHQQEGWWVQGLAGKLKSDDLAVGGMKSGYSIDTFGIMGGFDRKLRNGDTIGVAASYQSGDADSEGSALPVSTDVTNYGLHLWHARQFDAYRLMGMFSYSKTSGDAKMNYVGNELTSDLGATEISIGARADKEFKWGTVRMIPHAGVRASMIDVDDYTIEMGSEELFKVSEDKLWIFEVPVGVTFASSFEYARWNVQPYVDLTVRGRFGDTDSTFTLEGSNTSDSMKYDVTGDVIGDLRIGYMSTFQDLNLGMSYGLSAGDGGRQNHQIEATLRIDFN